MNNPDSAEHAFERWLKKNNEQLAPDEQLTGADFDFWIFNGRHFFAEVDRSGRVGDVMAYVPEVGDFVVAHENNIAWE